MGINNKSFGEIENELVAIVDELRRIGAKIETMVYAEALLGEVRAMVDKELEANEFRE